jgi:hypothetical protein
MSDAASTRTPAARFLRLVGFVRRLIDYGRELAASFQRGEIPLDPADPRDAAHRFGTRDLRIVLARIARGLLLAEALDARLARRGNGPDNRLVPAPQRVPRRHAPPPNALRDRRPTANPIPTTCPPLNRSPRRSATGRLAP